MNTSYEKINVYAKNGLGIAHPAMILFVLRKNCG
jgi:hypothetical protein